MAQSDRPWRTPRAVHKGWPYAAARGDAIRARGGLACYKSSTRSLRPFSGKIDAEPVSEPSTVARGQTGYGPPLRGGPKLCRQCEGTCAVICQLVSVDYEVRRTQLVGLLGVHHLENLCLEGDVFVERDLAIAIRIDLAEHLLGLESMSKPGGRE